MLTFQAFLVEAQSNSIEVLEKKIALERDDTTRINLIQELEHLVYADNRAYSDSLAIMVVKICSANLQIPAISKKLSDHYKNDLSWAYFTLGYNSMDAGEPAPALDNYLKSLKLDEELGNKKDIGKISGNLSQVFAYLGDYKNAIEYCLRAISIYEEINYPSGLSIQYTSLGQIYHDMKDYDKARDYYYRSLALDKSLLDSVGLGISYSNLGNLFFDLDLLDSALYYHQLSMNMKIALELDSEMSIPYTNIGLIYLKRGKLAEAYDYFKKSLEIDERNEDQIGLAISHYNLSTYFIRTGKKTDARKHSVLSLNIATEVGYVDGIMEAYKNMYLIDSLEGNFFQALRNFQYYSTYKDSLFNQNMRQNVFEQGMRFEFNKKTIADSIANANEREITLAHLAEKEAQLKSSRLFQLLMWFGIVFIVLFALFFYNRYKTIKRQKKLLEEKSSEIEFQKLIIEEKHKEITDSINYAQRLQHAILATEEEISSHLPENFLLYKPKDIVAGDFYFFETTPTHIFYAAADCTGHGVPGAMVSIVCSNALTRSVKEFDLSDPGKILDKTRELVVSTFEKSGQDVKDGMDISLIAIDRATKEIKWSGANNPLWYIEEGKMKEITATKQPIGKVDQIKPFVTHSINKGNSSLFLYLFTDGYADQFGGPKGKKFKYANMSKLLLEIHVLPLQEQKSRLNDVLETWRGSLEQIDDICVIGVRV